MKILLITWLAFMGSAFSDPMSKPEFTYTTYIAKPVEKVWNAITQKQLIDQYYLAPIHTLELRVGGTISYGVGKEFIKGEITRLETNKLLTHTFNFAGDESKKTVVTYSLSSVGGEVCALTVNHTGFESEDQTYANITGGWPSILSALKTLLETGNTMPWPEPE